MMPQVRDQKWICDLDLIGGPEVDPRVARTLFVVNIHPNLTTQEIVNKFASFGGTIQDPVFIKRAPYMRRCYCFIKFKNSLEAFQARTNLHMKPIKPNYPPVSIGYARTPPCPRLWIGNLPFDVDTGHLFKELDRFGQILKMEHFKNSGEVNVEFATSDAAQEAKDYLRGIVFKRSSLRDNSTECNEVPPEVQEIHVRKIAREFNIRGVVTDYIAPPIDCCSKDVC